MWMEVMVVLESHISLELIVEQMQKGMPQVRF
jgi:hypothetical protein